MPILKNFHISCGIELIVKLGNSGIYAKQRKVSVAHVSNGAVTETDYEKLMKNFESKFPIP